MFIAVLFRIAKTWKCPKYLSTDEWIKKMHIYSVIKKNEISQRQISNHITYMKSKKKKTNKLIYKTETDSQT